MSMKHVIYVLTPPPRWGHREFNLTDAYENITFPQLLLQAVMNLYVLNN